MFSNRKELVHTIVAMLIMLGVFFFLTWLVTKDFDEAKGDEGFVTYEELRSYDHDLQTKGGGIWDLWNDSKRQDQRIQNVWEYSNSIDKRLHNLEMQLQSRAVQPKQTLIAMASNEGGQSYSVQKHFDGNGWNVGDPIVLNYWGGESREIPFDGCVVKHKTRPNREQSEAYRYTNYAYQQGGRDMVLLWNAENGSRNPRQQSNVIFADGHREPSFGFCQLLKQRGYNADAINDPRFFSDPFRQLDRCTEKYEVVANKGQVWYARPHREARGINLYLECE